MTFVETLVFFLEKLNMPVGTGTYFKKKFIYLILYLGSDKSEWV
jgi:hypothetical protein